MLEGFRILFVDVDHTLIEVDSEVSWKEFMVAEGFAPESDLAEAQRFWNLYIRHEFPVEEYLAFQLREFRGRTVDEVDALARRHFESRIVPRIFPQARNLVAEARRLGMATAAVSSTVEPIIRPTLDELGVEDCVSTVPAVDGAGRYTGAIEGPYCLLEEKVVRARAYVDARGLSLREAVYFGDSTNDIPLLEEVGRAVVVNPNERLLAHAQDRGWDVEWWSLDGGERG